MILSYGACLGAAVPRVLTSAVSFSSSRARVKKKKVWTSTELAALLRRARGRLGSVSCCIGVWLLSLVC